MSVKTIPLGLSSKTIDAFIITIFFFKETKKTIHKTSPFPRIYIWYYRISQDYSTTSLLKKQVSIIYVNLRHIYLRQRLDANLNVCYNNVGKGG